MNRTLTHAGRWARLRASLLALAVLASACESADNLANNDPAALLDGATADSVASADSVATSDSLAPADSLAVALEVAGIEAALVSRRGTPFGPDGLWSGYTTLKTYHTPFNASINSDSPYGIIKRINVARNHNHQLVLMMTGGSHGNYITNGKFDLAKWKRRMDAFRTSAIKAAVAAGVSDGTVLGNNMMDEPNHWSWGGVMTKPLLDKMATYVKGIFPTLPAGVSIRWDWRPSERYRVVDFIATQYVYRFGSVTAWRDKAIAAAKLNGIKLMLSFNPINGGTRISGCPLGPTGGKGTYGGNCRMTPTQVRTAGYALGVSGCALLMWRYDDAFMSKSANISAFKDVKYKVSTYSRRSCRRA